MKLKNRLIAIILFLALLSCGKEEALVASNPNSDSALKFPEGTSFDDITLSIYEKFGVKIYWSENIKSVDISKTWTSDAGMASLNFGYLNEEQAGNMIHFLNDYIFSKTDPKLFNKVLRPNIYMLYDLNTLVFNVWLKPVTMELERMDHWLLSMYGEGAQKYPMFATQIHKLPSTDAEIFKYRRNVFTSFFNQLFKMGVIETPEQFKTEFDYTPRDLKYLSTDAEKSDFYMNQNFCGSANTISGDLTRISTTTSMPASKNFMSYLAFVYTYSKEDIENGAGIEGVPFKNYPKLLYFYDLVDQYMIEKYNYDLKQLHTLK